MSTPRDRMLAHLRGTTPTTEPTDDEAEGMFFSDDLPAVDRDAAPDYSPARELMLQRLWDERDRPIESGE